MLCVNYKINYLGKANLNQHLKHLILYAKHFLTPNDNNIIICLIILIALIFTNKTANIISQFCLY